MGEAFSPTGQLPTPFLKAIEAGWELPPKVEPLPGKGVTRRQARYVYRLVWDELRSRGGYRRPLRLQPRPGLGMLLPFGGRGLGVLPQRPPAKVSARLRGLALVGRSCAAWKAGCRLLVVTGMRRPELEELLVRGGTAWCTLDTLEEMLCRLER